ncbi:MAG: hypothetical protein CTY28_14465 [Hyphomicrobium sp.]|nr:MAG: hypothetical protein CTY28_14465 [Hyphomicrobium sp.]
MTIDLKGWWAVSDNGDDTVVKECVGSMPWGDKGIAVLVRDPKTQECDLTPYVTGYGWFAPEHKAAADAHAAKLIADYNAVEPDDDDGDGETEEVA